MATIPLSYTRESGCRGPDRRDGGQRRARRPHMAREHSRQLGAGVTSPTLPPDYDP